MLRWVGLAILLALAWLAVVKLDLRQIARALGRADLAGLGLALGASVLSLSFQAARWKALVRPVHPQVRLRSVFTALVAGYAVGLLLPARASDLARAHLLARRTGASTMTLAATTLVDHLVNTAALLATVACLAAASDLPAWLRSASLLSLAAAALALGALWLMRPPLAPPAAAPLRSLAGAAAQLRLGLAAVARPRALLLSWILALLSWGVEIAAAHIALQAFGLDAGLQASGLIVLGTALSAAASLSPGNAGTFELACVMALSGLGVPREAAVAFGLGYHAVHLVPVAVLGGAGLLVYGHRSRPVADRSERAVADVP